MLATMVTCANEAQINASGCSLSQWVMSQGHGLPVLAGKKQRGEKDSVEGSPSFGRLRTKKWLGFEQPAALLRPCVRLTDQNVILLVQGRACKFEVSLSEISSTFDKRRNKTGSFVWTCNFRGLGAKPRGEVERCLRNKVQTGSTGPKECKGVRTWCVVRWRVTGILDGAHQFSLSVMWCSASDIVGVVVGESSFNLFVTHRVCSFVCGVFDGVSAELCCSTDDEIE